MSAAPDSYVAFLASKAACVSWHGLTETPKLAGHLFPFQSHCVDFCLRAGSSGLFLDTGLGKTEIQLEWHRHAAETTNGRSIMLVPLAVAGQAKRRADRWGYQARIIRNQDDAGEGLNICNYDRLGLLDPNFYGAVSLDESSILKSFTGKTTRALIQAFAGHRFKLAATATPAPNDHMELGQHSEFLSIMNANEMLSRWFINDTSTASQQWRLKAHATSDFWHWMASWARMADKPSDLGDSDNGFDLNPFSVIRHRARGSAIDARLTDMFGTTVMSATSLHDVKRQTSAARADAAAAVVMAEPEESWLLWCDTNYEADALKRAIPGAMELRGNMTADEKERRLGAFETGEARYLIAKPSMCGFGLDWSHCARMAFVGRSYSYEVWYQAVRRCWRFGQTRPVDVHLVVAEGESEIGRVIDRKSTDHQQMKTAMREAMGNGAAVAVRAPYSPNHQGELPAWL